MKIKINGAVEEFSAETGSIADLLLKKNCGTETAAVKINGVVFGRKEFDSAEVHGGDSVEIYGLSDKTDTPYAGFSTAAIHSGRLQADGYKASVVPVYETASFAYDSAEDMEEVFSGRKSGYIYSRISNPTVTAFEQKINALEKGIGSLALSSGMAAITTLLLSLTSRGDEVVSASGLFSGTIQLFKHVFEKFGVAVRYAKKSDAQDFEALINERTRLIFLESVGNPKLDVPDIKKISEVARKNSIPLVVDSTATTPYILDAKCFGADITVYSATKYIAGCGTAVGGVLTDLGSFNWAESRSTAVREACERFKETAFLSLARKFIAQTTGPCVSPFNAYLQSLGLETLELRLDRHSENALVAAKYLEAHPKVRSVSYPGLESSGWHHTAKKQFNGRYGGLLTFTLADAAECYRFINAVKLSGRLTNFGESRTLVIHPYSTIYAENTEEEKKDAGVTKGLIRVSAGLENAGDILNDFEQALKAV